MPGAGSRDTQPFLPQLCSALRVEETLQGSFLPPQVHPTPGRRIRLDDTGLWFNREPSLRRSTDLGKSEDTVAVVSTGILGAKKKMTNFSEW